MRSEKEMMELILNIAKEDDDILAVLLKGSRTNEKVPKDIFQDYDVVYIVKSTLKYIENVQWIDVFGERLYMQKPEAVDKSLGMKVDFEKSYGYLIQLADGNRIDLHLIAKKYGKHALNEDFLTVVLLDKNNLLPKIKPPSDEEFWIKKPTEAEFQACCNEFWWCLNNVAKGLWRNELLYVMDMLDYHVRPELKKMITWYAGIETKFSLSVGKSGKYLNKYIPVKMWEEFLSTYSKAEDKPLWQGVFKMCSLFQDVTLIVSREFNFTYDKEEAENSIMFLRNVERLPKDATEIFKR